MRYHNLRLLLSQILGVKGHLTASLLDAQGSAKTAAAQ